ncbi:hypothetical protein OAG71_04825, partial [bacterium]|nr:hypothetical protein [bacterium]
PGPRLLRRIFGNTMFAQVQCLEIKMNRKLTDIGRLRELTGLKTLVICDCPQLKNLDGLANSQLRILCIDRCPKLQNIDPLLGVTSLEFIDLWRCPLVPDVDALEKANLKRFSLKGCPNITNIDSLKGHANLSLCYLDNCSGLRNVGGLIDRTLASFSIDASDQLLTSSGLSSLGRKRRIALIDCGIQSLEEVWQHIDVKMMRLCRCPNLLTLRGVDQTIGMETLTLSQCPSLTSLDGLEKSEADAVYIFNCDKLRDIEALNAMTNLSYLRIEDCPQVDPAAIKAIHEKAGRRLKATAKPVRHTVRKVGP